MNQKIEGNRIFSVLSGDKQNPEKILNYLRAEITEVAKQYVNLCGKVEVRYRLTQDGLNFMIEIPVSSVRGMFYL